MKSVLFVCTGNTCRSPLAAALFSQALGERADVRVDSAGVSAFPGQPMSRESAAILEERGIDQQHQSQPVTRQLVDSATHIFTMTAGHRELLLAEFPEAGDRVFLATELTELEGRGIGADIPDPFGMGADAYREVARVLDQVMPSLVAVVDR